MNDKEKKKATQAMKDYDPKNRDFQRTEEDLDNVSKSEKIALKENKNSEKPAGHRDKRK